MSNLPLAPGSPAPFPESLLELLSDRLTPHPALLTRETFAVVLDSGTSTFDRLRERGKVGPRPFHLAGLGWHRDEVLAWLRHRCPDGELHEIKTWPAVWDALQRRGAPR